MSWISRRPNPLRLGISEKEVMDVVEDEDEFMMMMMIMTLSVMIPL